ncbi:MAG: type II secretion system protein [Kiritimatiellae bacterium]|nr:type II secretion system protein [Kiritimatiellia bacterium]
MKSAPRVLLDRRGFTLTEVTAATAVLVIVFGALVATFINGVRNATAANKRMEAIHEAREWIERVVACNYNDQPLSVGTHWIRVNGPDQSIQTNGYWIVSQNPDYEDLKDVEMVVQWQHPFRKSPSEIRLYTSVSAALSKNIVSIPLPMPVEPTVKPKPKPKPTPPPAPPANNSNNNNQNLTVTPEVEEVEDVEEPPPPPEWNI